MGIAAALAKGKDGLGSHLVVLMGFEGADIDRIEKKEAIAMRHQDRDTVCVSGPKRP